MDDTLGAVATVDAGAAGGESSGTTTAVETPSSPAEGTPGTGIPEVPAGGSPEGASGGGGDETSLGEAEGGEEEIDLSEGGKGEVSPAKQATRKAISELKKTNPEAAKAWAKEHYHLSAYEEVYPTVQEARSAQATIESLGGEEGILKAAEEMEEHRGDVSRFHEGSPQLPQDLIQASAEKSATLASGLLRELGEKHPDLFDQALIPAMSSRMESGNIYSVTDGIAKAFETLEGHIREGDGQAAFDLLQKIRTSHKSINDWMGRLKDMAGKAGEAVAKRDPEREALEKEKQSLAADRTKHERQVVGEKLLTMNHGAMTKVSSELFKSLKLSDSGRKDFLQTLFNNVSKAMREDKIYQRNVNAKWAQGDKDRIADFIHGKFAELLPAEFRKLRNARYPNWKPTNGSGGTPPPRTPPAAGSNVQNGAKIPLEEARRIGVDFSKTSQLQWINALGGHDSPVTLKNGKVVHLDMTK